MTARIGELISKRDSDEIVRDEIASIIKLESENQVNLARQAGQSSPRDWALRVYTERSQVWQQYKEGPANCDEDALPIVNVMLSSEQLSKGASTHFSQKRYDTQYFIDVYGYGASEESHLGHVSGDFLASKARSRAKKIVRNILEHSTYDALRQSSIVSDLTIQSIEFEHPDFSGKNEWRSSQYIKMARITVNAELNEFSEQVRGENFELLVDLIDSQDGEFVVASLDFSPTP